MNRILIKALFAISRYIQSKAKGWIVLSFFSIFVIFMTFVLTNASQTKVDFNTHFYYTPDEAYSMLSSLNNEERLLMRKDLLIIDSIIPFLYTAFSSLLISWLFKRGFNTTSSVNYLNLLPFIVAFFDILENLGIVTLISSYPNQLVSVSWISSICTMVKLCLACVVIFLIIVGIIKASLYKFKVM